MAVPVERGTKRTCQNGECGVRFYDLMRKPIVCPICHSPFVPPPTREILLEDMSKTRRNAVHRPGNPIVSIHTTPEGSELQLMASDDAGDAEVEIEAESADAILEPEDDDADTSVVVLPRSKDQK